MTQRSKKPLVVLIIYVVVIWIIFILLAWLFPIKQFT